MNECPTCGRRIRGDICPYCDEELVQDDSVDSTPVSGESSVDVFSCDHQWQADFIMSALESEGIPAHMESGNSRSGLDHGDESGRMTGDMIIVVDEEDADRAREIIKSAEHDLDAGEH
jgi:hypothetical protein